MAASELAQEKEELVEAAVSDALAAAATIPVCGALAPSPLGDVKELSTDTYVSVVADQTSQDLDHAGAGSLHTYMVRVTVRYAIADDASGTGFRDECRRVRAVLLAATGDGCAALSAAGKLACDGFILNSTSTDFEPGDNPVRSKTYTATLKGRTLTTTAA